MTFPKVRFTLGHAVRDFCQGMACHGPHPTCNVTRHTKRVGCEKRPTIIISLTSSPRIGSNRGFYSEDFMYQLCICADPIFLEQSFAKRVKNHKLRDLMADGKAMAALEAKLAQWTA